MKILVLGANGQVGRALVESAPAGHIVLAPPRTVLDLIRPETITKFVKERPDVVVNAAAYTAVDQAEDEPVTVFAINRDGPSELARQCAAAGIPLIHLSTDYVFDGTKQNAYVESDTTNPINVYGQSKEQGEIAVRDNHKQHVILRCSWIFGRQGGNFVRAILMRASRGETLRVVDDQRGCPTAASSIARAIFRLIEHIGSGADTPWGTFHFAGRDAVTWFEFAKAIAAAARPWLNATPTIEPIASSQYPGRTRRPANSVLDCTLISKCFGIRPEPWRDALADAIAGIGETIGEVQCVRKRAP